jgi:hypothetical protein
MAAPVGNQNAVRARRWREAIMRALARKCGSVEQGLDAAADKLACLAIDDGDKWALEEIGDRVDGKPAQALIHQGDEDGGPVKVERIERVIRRADAANRNG